MNSLKEDVLNYLERLNYEVVSTSNTIVTIIENNKAADVLSGRMFQKYNKDFITKFAEYELVKQQVSRALLKESGVKRANINWNIIFATNELTTDILELPCKQHLSVTIEENEEYVKLEDLHYSVMAMRDIILKLFDRHKMDDLEFSILEADSFKEYQKILAETERDYDRLKEKLSDSLITSDLKNRNIDWEFNFLENLFEIYVL